ncbi:MAG: hypothetical protein U0L74_10945 [Paludibacteraceae bacterium]|nr:hypothetical protein [Paludibacteraceae bacterium]
MKKVFNLSVILAVLASALTFTSCSDDDDEATIDFIKAEGKNAWTINAEAGIDEIELSKVENGKTTLDQPLSKTLTDEAEGKTTYILDFDKLGLSGKFEITVIDKDGGKTKMDVTVGAAAVTYNFSAKSIAVEAGKEYVYSKKAGEGAAEGSFKVTAAEAGSVTLEIGGKTVTLSDAGASWLSNDFEAWKNADVTNGADVLLCLLKESTNIAGATESSNEVISGQASATYFAAK